ncbi:hypothetical protein AB0J86_21185 [Micromonospora sp. NPDC049559]|uniref:hypothetical protein n=1 Tax=Micromonospora sp. NPDC049559 TaxID=3155923 RepID=UPI0034296C7D
MTYRRSRPTLAALAGTVVAVLAAAPAVAAPAAPASPPAEGNEWTADLGTVDADDVNVGTGAAGLRLADPNPSRAGRRAAAEGMLLLTPHRLATPANRVRAELAAAARPGGGAEVEVRGLRGADWTEWRTATATAPAVFDRPVDQVQARIVLTAERPEAAPTASALRLRADSVAVTAAATPGLTYQVYATREGLVGGMTANGHVITSRDHFVSFPSARSLSPKNTGDYTAKVCTTSGSRCEYAPVWERGPWNLRDDYWNPPTVRETFADLPQGKPEAQAAYQDGYNGGKNDRGSTVANPAGIDLADGTFWDGLLLTNNAWVNVSYLWTGTGSRGTVGSGPLNIRSGPGTSYAVKGLAAQYAKVPIECWVTGTSVAGPYGTTTRWDRLATGEFVSHSYISATTGEAVPAC